jgi:hypothetical protein
MVGITENTGIRGEPPRRHVRIIIAIVEQTVGRFHCC